MISIPTDEASVFDALAIIHVKEEKLGVDLSKDTHGIRQAINWACYQGSHDFDAFHAVDDSQEYADLVQINREIWDLVDKAHRNQVSAKEVADANDRRYLLKKAIQKRFFSGELSEVKSHEACNAA